MKESKQEIRSEIRFTTSWFLQCVRQLNFLIDIFVLFGSLCVCIFFVMEGIANETGIVPFHTKRTADQGGGTDREKEGRQQRWIEEPMSVCFLKRERRGPGTTSRSSWRLQSSLSLFPAVAPVSLFYFLVRFCKQNKKKEKKKKAAALRVFVSQAASDRTQRGKNPLSVIAAAYLRLALSCCPAERTKVVSPLLR